MKIQWLKIGFGLSLILVGCAATPNTHYYLIDIPAYTQPAAMPQPVILGIERVTSDDLYSDDRLVFRESPHEAQFYHYHRWITNPPRIVSEKLVTRLKEAKLFKNVVTMPARIPPDYTLQVHLRAFEEWDESEKWYGQVRFSAALIQSTTQEIVWQEDFTRKTAASERKPLAVIQALSKSVDLALNDLLNELGRWFQENPAVH
jgi:ABC-type uncharacterized transport system auxiliary subunit